MLGEPKRTETSEGTSLLVQVGEEPAQGNRPVREGTGKAGGCSFQKPTEHRFSQIKEQ